MNARALKRARLSINDKSALLNEMPDSEQVSLRVSTGKGAQLSRPAMGSLGFGNVGRKQQSPVCIFEAFTQMKPGFLLGKQRLSRLHAGGEILRRWDRLDRCRQK